MGIVNKRMSSRAEKRKKRVSGAKKERKFLVLIMRMICMINMDKNMMHIMVMSRMHIMVIDNGEDIIKMIIIIMKRMDIMRKEGSNNKHHQNNKEMVEGIVPNVVVAKVKDRMERENIIRDGMGKQRVPRMEQPKVEKFGHKKVSNRIR